jgi:spore coat protein CotH
MNMRNCAAVVVLASWLSLVLTAGAEPKSVAKDGKKDRAKEFFGLAKVHDLHLGPSQKEWTKMQPAPPRFGFMPGGPGGAPKGQDKGDTHKGAGFGTEFPWGTGEVTIDGQTFKAVGLRYKGNFTYVASSRGLKRPIKIDFARNSEGQRFLGLKKLNLNNGHTDVSKARESLSWSFFRAAGVPAPRTAYALVTLSVPEKYDREFVGLYTLVEQVDKTFLKDRFGNGKGMLLKPEGLQNGLPHFGDGWRRYEQSYRPHGETDEKQQKRLMDFTRLVNQPDGDLFRREIGSYLDVKEFLRFLAANAVLANLDSFLGFGHNFYLYLRPDTNRFVFIPWDLDLSMGAWPVAGTPEQQVNLSIMHPHRGTNRLIDRLLAVKEINEQYRRMVKELIETVFTKERLSKELDVIENVVKEPIAREAKAVKARRETAGGFGFGPPGGVFGSSVPPRMFIEKRTESVSAQLAGKTCGYVPPAGFGFGPGPGRFGGPQPGGFGRPGGFGGPGPGGFGGTPPRPGEIMPRPLQDQLKLTPEQRKKFAELQEEIDRKIKEILTEEQKGQLERMRRTPPGGPGGPGRP